MNILLSSGGTGGHIYPSLALAEAIIENNKNNQVMFVGSKSRMESQVIPNNGYKFIGLDLDNFKRGILGKANSTIKMAKAYFECRRLIKENNIDIVMGFGNYITVPVLLAAKHMKVKTVIHEQNALPGKANLMLQKYVDAVIGCYEINLEYFDNSKTYIYGNPRAQKAYETKIDDSFITKYNLNNDLPLIVIFMGSLGSSSVNSILNETFDKMSNDKYQVLYATGKGHNIDKTLFKDNIKVVESVDGIQAFLHANLAMTRGGATTIAELAALQVPSIIVPSPYVPDNGQFMNAKELLEKDACILIEEKNLKPDHLLDTLNDVLVDQKKLKELKDNIKQFGYIHANNDIIDLLYKLIGE